MALLGRSISLFLVQLLPYADPTDVPSYNFLDYLFLDKYFGLARVSRDPNTSRDRGNGYLLRCHDCSYYCRYP